MKLLLSFISTMFLLAILLAGGGSAWFFYEYNKPGPLEEETLVNIPPGSSLDAISRRLSESGALEQPLLFKITARLSGAGSSLKAGEYGFPPHITMAETLDMLRKGETFQRLVTVREGLTSFEIVRLLNETPNLTGEVTATPPEGTLLPDTYSHQKDEPRAAVLARMAEAMKALRAELFKVSVPLPPAENGLEPPVVEDSGLAVLPEAVRQLCGIAQDDTAPPVNTVSDECWNQIVTLASIVEKETGHPEERPRVAGVFLNRLERGIPLQTDPTVIYAITKGEHKNGGKGPLGRRLLTKDLEFDSPYNTYKYPGLPPGPIANPGRASIMAVLNPEKHEFIYFVADGTGGHVFAKTLEEHNRNVAEWRKIRKASGK